MRIDAHQHFWRLERGDYAWLTPDLTSLYRDFEPTELKPALTSGRIDATILVQAAPTDAETAFLLDLAAIHPWIAGVVGWTDLAAPDAVARIAQLASEPRLVGLRPMLQDMEDRNWINRAVLQPAINAMATHGLVFDALIQSDQIGCIEDLARQYRQLTIVLDHAGKPAIDADLSAWRQGIVRLAAHPNVHVKFSGLLTEMQGQPDAKILEPLLHHMLATFGAERMLWGSDWPVVTSRATHGEWLAITEHLIAPLPEADRTAIMGDNAARIYGIARPGHAAPVPVSASASDS